MARRITQKQLKHDEFVEATVDFAQWLEDNWSMVLKITATVAVAVIVVVGWRSWSARSLRDAEKRLSVGITQYNEARAAGFADTEALSSVLATFQDLSAGRSTPARTARFYEGATLFHLGRLDEAVAALEPVAEDTEQADTLAGTAELLLAQVDAAAGRTDAAMDRLQALAVRVDPPIPVDRVLLELGSVQAQAGLEDDARASWQRVLDEFPASASASEARSLLQ